MGIVNLVCNSCGARYQVREERIRGRRFRATCKRCGEIITARCTNNLNVVVDADSGNGNGYYPATKNGNDYDGLVADDAVWYVAIEGNPHGPLTFSEVCQAYYNKQIDLNSYAWQVGNLEWYRLIELTEFAPLWNESKAIPSQTAGSPDPDDVSLASTMYRAGDLAADQSSPEEPLNQTIVHFPIQETPENNALLPNSMMENGTVDFDPNATLAREGCLKQQHNPGQDIRRESVFPPSPFVGAGFLQRKAVLPPPTENLPSPAVLSPALPSSPNPLIPSGGDGKVVEERKIEINFSPSPLPQPLLPETLASPGNSPLRSPTAMLSASPVPPGNMVVENRIGIPNFSPVSFAEEGQQVLLPIASKAPFWTSTKIVIFAVTAGCLLLVLLVGGMFGLSHYKKKIRRTASQPSASQLAGLSSSGTSSSDEVIKSIAPTSLLARRDLVKKEIPPIENKEEPVDIASSAAGEIEKVADNPNQITNSTVGGKKIIGKSEAFKEGVVIKNVDNRESGDSKEQPSPTETLRKSINEEGRTNNAKAVLSRRNLPEKKSSKSKIKPKANTDEILAAGTESLSGRKGKGGKSSTKGNSSSPASDTPDADEILAVGSGASSKKKTESIEAKKSHGQQQKQTQRESQSLTSGRPTQNQILAAIKSVLPQVRGCNDKYQQQGIIRVQITLKPHGRAMASIIGSFAGTPIGFCVLGAIEQARFPKYSGNEINITYPFKLE